MDSASVPEMEEASADIKQFSTGLPVFFPE
jgi:hypothetical protein